MITTENRNPGRIAAQKPATAPQEAVSASRSVNPEPQAEPFNGLVLGVLVGLTDGMAALVSFKGSPGRNAIPARVLAALRPDDIGKAVALQFELGDTTRPVILGLLHSGICQPDTGAPQTASPADELTLSASRKLTLRCGRASITLNVDGDIELRGQNLLSRAAGKNRIKGSSVSLN